MIWKKALSAFKYASEIYKVKHNKPPVIVYDNISQIVNEDPKFLIFFKMMLKRMLITESTSPYLSAVKVHSREECNISANKVFFGSLIYKHMC